MLIITGLQNSTAESCQCARFRIWKRQYCNYCQSMQENVEAASSGFCTRLAIRSTAKHGKVAATRTNLDYLELRLYLNRPLGVPIYFKQFSCRTEEIHGALAWRTQHLHGSWWSLFGKSYIPISYQYVMLLPTYKVERNFLFLAVVPIRFILSLWHLISHKINHVHPLCHDPGTHMPLKNTNVPEHQSLESLGKWN